MVAVGDIFLGAFLQVLFQKLMSREVLDLARGEGVHKKLEKWSSTLRMIQAVLSDAEEKQLTSEAVQLWLADLRDLAYDVEDVLDKFYTKQIQNLHHGQASSSKLWNFIHMRKINSEINEITKRLEDISSRENKLGLNKIERSVPEWKRPPSSSLPDSPVVVGRDEDKKKIVELLLSDNQSKENFDVVGLVGMPGVGKTTLARLAFKDDAMKHFDIKVWVSVSDDFDYVRLTKAILKSIDLESKSFDEFSQIQDHLSKVLVGKKFLIVLDDVWNKKYELWLTLQSPFGTGSPGSKILVTTRNEDVAKLMAAVECSNLECISDDDCWKLFVQHLSNRNISEPSKLESQRENVVSKCKGLPFAAQTLGGLLRCKEIDEWKDVLEDKLWTQPEHSNILSLLKLSYHYLPPYVKRCFAYCSIFPEDYEFEEKELILLWMAEGLLQNPKGSRQMEDLGREYFKELFSRSFFQKSKKDESKYVMHDLFNDFARLVAGEIGFTLEDKVDNDKRCRIFTKVRHSAYLSAELEGMHRLEVFSNLKHLRTFLPLSHSYDERKYLASNFTLQILPKLQNLRVLSLKGYCIRELPDSIGELKLLRYLDLSYTDITSLPESISHLYNLQTLLLEGCVYLNALPTGLKNLIYLRHLIYSNKRHLKWTLFGLQEDGDLQNRGCLEGMPSNMGKLTNLQTLSYFVVGKESSSSGIGELGPLLHLCGTLHISGLENVNGAEDVVRANLAGKDGIDVLLLEWNGKQTADPDIFGSLQLPQMLKELTVISYSGSKFPAWMGNSLISKMVKMRLKDCRRCKLLPPLGQLPLLKELTIEGLSGVENVGSEFYGDGGLNAFPLLETLCFKRMENWKDWYPDDINNGIDRFPQLKKLVVEWCPMLKGKLPKNLPSLKDLEVCVCEQLTVSIPSSQMLCSLIIGYCAEVVCENYAHLKSVKSIKVFRIRKFRYQPERFMQGLTREEDVVVPGCNGMTALPQDKFCQLTSLCQLEIYNSSLLYLQLDLQETEQAQWRIPTKLETLHLWRCYNLLKEIERLDLTLLKKLTIVCCQSLMSFSKSSLPSSLKVLYIEDCENLKSVLVLEKYCGTESNCTLNCLESLTIKQCRSLESITSAKLPDTLRQFEVSDCPSLICLSSSGKLPEALEVLDVSCCNRLTALSSDDKLPKALKRLRICGCGELKWITNGFYGNTCLQSLSIYYCKNLTSLPEGLHHLANLSEIVIGGCENLVSFPEGWLAASNLRELSAPVTILNNMVAHPRDMQGFPPNLTSLTIVNLDVSKPLFQRGLLHRLTSLRKLNLDGKATDMVSFPPKDEKEKEHEKVGRKGMMMMMVLPTSLITLQISGFENLEKLSADLQYLTSLRHLYVYSCKKLKSLPKGGLPLSLLSLTIRDCRLLSKKCEKDTGLFWPYVAHIPYVECQASSYKALAIGLET